MKEQEVEQAITDDTPLFASVGDRYRHEVRVVAKYTADNPHRVLYQVAHVIYGKQMKEPLKTLRSPRALYLTSGKSNYKMEVNYVGSTSGNDG